MVRPWRKRSLGRPRHRWENNIKMDLREMGWGTWIELLWLRIGIGGGSEPSDSIKCGEIS